MRHDEDLREPLGRRQGSQVSMRMARGRTSLLSSHGSGIRAQHHNEIPKQESYRTDDRNGHSLKKRSLMGGGKDIKLHFSKETRREEDF